MHHVISRGAGGGDGSGNLVELCRFHHAEVHTLGRDTFAAKYGLKAKWDRARSLHHAESKTKAVQSSRLP